MNTHTQSIENATLHDTKTNKQNHPKELTQTHTKKAPTIAVIGLGYVGLPLALQASRHNYPVIGYDVDQQLVSTLNKREAPSFLDHNDRRGFKEHTMTVGSDSSILKNANAIIVCVPTPVRSDHQPDLRPLIAACESLAPFLKRGTLVVIESTVNPGVCDEIILPILVRGSSLVPEEDFLFAHCPERINPGDSVWDVNSIPRVLGGAGPKSTGAAQELYSALIDAPIHPMKSIREAEAVKVTENSFRDINIAFVNELAMSFKKLDIDIVNVLEGAATKPFGFMAHFPGCGVGGHCIPVDPYYLISYARKNGFTHRFLEIARDINNNMPGYTVDLLEKALLAKGRDLLGSEIALLGLSYKRDVPDLRESPALMIEQELIRRGAAVRSYDPLVLSQSSVYTLSDALHHVNAALIATDHSVFRSLTPTKFAIHGVDIVVDGRNCLDKESFIGTTITYHGIGR